MTDQVSGSTKTLLIAIRDGDVPKPGLMGWNEWQQWRRDVGGRPTVVRDGATTTTTQESALWKSVMCELYGDQWALTLASGEAMGPVAQAPLPSEPGLAPAAGAGAVTPRTSPRVERSPGSGDARPGAASPGSGKSSPVPSWSSREPGSPTRLNLLVLKAYSPEKELLEVYQNRIRRQAGALAGMGEPLSEGVLETLITKSEIEMRLYEEAKGDPQRQTRILKREFAFEMVDLNDTPEQAHKISALEALLENKGVDVMALLHRKENRLLEEAMFRQDLDERWVARLVLHRPHPREPSM